MSEITNLEGDRLLEIASRAGQGFQQCHADLTQLGPFVHMAGIVD